MKWDVFFNGVPLRYQGRISYLIPECTDLPSLASMLTDGSLFLPSMCWDYGLSTTPTQRLLEFRGSNLQCSHGARTLPNKPLLSPPQGHLVSGQQMPNPN